MRGAKLIKISTILLIVTGIANIVLGALNLTGTSQMLVGNKLAYYNMILFCGQGIIALCVGVFGFLSRSQRGRVQMVMISAWLVLVVTFLLYFIGYGYNWGIVLYELLCVISAIVYFWGAKRNVEAIRESRERRK